MSRRPWLAAALCAILAAAVAGCTAGNDDRPANLQAIARWQDARLAPADSLAAMLTSPDAHVRLAAVRAAGLIGRDDILPRLAETLADPSLTVQREACFALGVLGDTLAVPDLELAAGAGKLSLRIAALRGLAHVPNRGTALLAAATADEPEEAAAAWDGLRNQADQVPRAELLAAIEAGLATPHADVLWRVLRCAERAPDPALLEPITPHLRSHHVQARVHAWRALGRLPGHASLQAALAAWKHGPGRGGGGGGGARGRPPPPPPPPRPHHRRPGRRRAGPGPAGSGGHPGGTFDLPFAPRGPGRAGGHGRHGRPPPVARRGRRAGEPAAGLAHPHGPGRPGPAGPPGRRPPRRRGRGLGSPARPRRRS
jgi:hypothetical protein